jgi:hypothetical protein
VHDSFSCGLTDIAWRLADLTPADLWGRYLGLGGTRPLDALGAYLQHTTAWPAAEHNPLAHALNERLWDLGCPSLAPYRHPGSDHDVGPKPGHDGEVGTR